MISVGDVLLCGFAMILSLLVLGIALALFGTALQAAEVCSIYRRSFCETLKMYGQLSIFSTLLIWPGVIAGALISLFAVRRGAGGWAPIALIGAFSSCLFLFPFEEFLRGTWPSGYLFLSASGAAAAFVFWSILRRRRPNGIVPQSHN